MHLKDMQADQADIVPLPSADAPDERHVSTMLIDRGGSRLTWLYALIAVLVIGGGITLLVSRFIGGDEATAAIAPSAAAIPTHDVTLSSDWKNSCKEDLSKLSELRQFYCNSLMPTLQALSNDNDSLRAELAELKEHGPGGTAKSVWIAIGLLGALGVANLILARRRPKTS